jgi:hypothetical protein
MLAREADEYEATHVTSAAEVYGLMEDWAGERPDLPYAVLRKAVGGQFGMAPREAERRYPRLRRVHAEAQRRALNYEARRRRVPGEISQTGN